MTAEDPFGNVVPTYTSPVTLALATNLVGGTLGPAAKLTATPVNGVASFTGLTINNVSPGYTIQATSGVLTSATTNPLTVQVITPTKLAVTSQPPSSVAASSPTINVTVAAEDGQGNIATTYVGQVTLTLGSNPGGSTLGGTLTAQAVGGVATFTGLSLNKVGTGYTLVAASTGLASATSGQIAVTSAAATQLVVAIQPQSSVVAGSGFGLVVKPEDANGNVDLTYNSPVTVTLANNPGGATLGTGLNASATASISNPGPNGVVSAINVSNGGSGYTSTPVVTLSGGGGSGATATAVVTNGVVTAINIGNIGSGYTSAPTVTIIPQTVTVTAFNGVATFTGLTLNTPANGYKVLVSSGTLTPATTTAINVTPAPTSQLVVLTQPLSSVTASTPVAATATSMINSSGALTGFTITNPGAGYAFPPAVKLSDGFATGAAATVTATVGGGSVTNFTIAGGGAPTSSRQWSR